jgi:hypothetical protein
MTGSTARQKSSPGPPKRPCSDSQVSVFGPEFGSEHAASSIVYAISTTNLSGEFAIVGGPLGPHWPTAVPNFYEEIFLDK